jgi:endoglucanase
MIVKLASLFRKGAILFFLLIVGVSYSQKISQQIFINQLGFYSVGSKKAVVSGVTASVDFYITASNLRDTFYRGKLSDERVSPYSSLRTRMADFSAFEKPGSYVLFIPGVGHSAVFRVGEHILQTAGAATLKGFYFQRSANNLEERYAGKWHRSSGNIDNEVLIHPSAASVKRPAGTVISSSGGWYDAGDYNKYVVNSGITMGTLLSAYEDDPAYYSQLEVNIPESRDGIPDIVNEVLYNVRWMLTMQDPSDGGVYHKCTHASFDDMVMPGVTRQPRWLVQKSTAAALNQAAVMAQAARVFKGFSQRYPRLSDSCLRQAHAAFRWAQQHPDVVYNQDAMNKDFSPPISTGAYGDGEFGDEFFWAASELYLTTRDTFYLPLIQKYLPAKPSLPSWNQVALLDNYSLSRFGKNIQNQPYAKLLAIVKQQILDLADNYVQFVKVSPLHTPMGESVRDFVWGSNSTAANQGILLINAFRITGNDAYLQTARENADYLLGRNPTGYCFVTGLGSKSPMHPHHRISVADGITEPVPGLLVGGPNPGRQDGCSYTSIETEMAYTDDDCSYASNEIAINWNAPAVYLFNALEKYSSGKAPAKK